MKNAQSSRGRQTRARAALAAALGVLLCLSCGDAQASDWPMLAHDPARSGATGDEVRPPFERKWYRLFPDEGLPAGTQAVVSGGRVFVGTLAGVVHAMDAETGADVWTYRAGGPILHACAVGAGKVFLGCADGGVYALDAASGALAWRVATGAAVWNAPLIHGGTVLIGSRDGRLYALEAASGAIRWRAEAAAPFLSSPALDARSGRVYAASEDLRVHAYRLDGGEELWRSAPLCGVTFRGYHPVVAPDGAVMVTTAPAIPLDAFQEVLLDMVKEVFGDFASWRHSKEENARLRAENFERMRRPETYAAQLEFLRQRLEAEPALRTFFLLDPETGRERALVPIVYAESMNGVGAPPVVTPVGEVIVKYQALLRSRYEHYSPFLNVGRLDPRTGAIAPILDQERTYGWHDSLLLVHDEMCQLTASGRVLLNAHQDNVNGLDLDTLRGYEAPFCTGIHEPREGEALAIWRRLLEGGALPPGQEWLARGTAVYGGGSVIDAAVSIAGDSFYFIPTHELSAGAALIACRTRRPDAPARPTPPPLDAGLDDALLARLQEEPWDWDILGTPRLCKVIGDLPASVPGTSGAPLAEAARRRAASIAAGDLDRALWEAPRPRPIAPPGAKGEPDGAAMRIGARLEAATRELVSRTWRPWVFPSGKHPTESYRFFTDPLEELEALALAWPFLPEDLRDKVKERAARLVEDALRGKAAPAGAGDRRTRYEEPPARLIRVRDDLRREGLERLYPLWLWGHVSGDWGGVDARWSTLRELAGGGPGGKEPLDAGNARAAGAIALCRLARRAGDADALERALPRARAALRERLCLEAACPRGRVITEAPVLRSILGRWRSLSPEVGRLIARDDRAAEARLLATIIDRHRPTWWLAWNVETLWRNESPFELPTVACEVFAARALILGEPPAQLEPFLDLPWCAGDAFFVRKLALSLWSAGRLAWVDVR